VARGGGWWAYLGAGATAGVRSGVDRSSALTSSGAVKLRGYDDRRKVGVAVAGCGLVPCPITSPVDVVF